LIVLLSTCDGDHFDYFKDAADYQSAFKEFVGKIPTNGSLITHLSDADCKSVSRASAGRVIDADGEPLITLNTPGLHMRQNAQLALSLARVLGISLEKAKKSLSGFAGSWRRMERKGNYQASTPVFDDYAHHPREITATLQALREQYPDRRIVCVFQPHTHDRTLKLYPQFTEAFRDANFVIIPNIYDARSDTETSEVDRTKLVEDIAKASNVECIDGHSLMETEQLLRSKILKRDDVLICMGAGDITTLASSILQ
jgi:UDP-N-acetylmuramate--alanine ligase